MARLFRTTIGNLYLLTGSLFFGSVAVIGGLLAPRARVPWRCARTWARYWLAAAGVRLEVEGRKAIDTDRCFVFMPNHQSYFDIPSMLASLPAETRFLAKRSLFQIPVFGWALKMAGFIPVDRQHRSRAKQAFAAASESLQEGYSILIFPEETRSPDGKILPFQRGGFLIGIKAGVPIVPVGISGTRSVQKKGSLIVDPGVVTVRYGEPVPTEGRGVKAKRELLAEVRAEVARLSGGELQAP